MKTILTGLALLLSLNLCFSQDLLDEIDGEAGPSAITSTWKSQKIVNFESSKLAAPGDFVFIVAHRFASVENGFEDLFGLDQAVTRLQFIYGLTDWLHLEASRTSRNATYELASKVRLAQQVEQGFPFNISLWTGADVNTGLDKDILPGLEFSDRLSYAAQLTIARKFNRNLSLALVPSIAHNNYTPINEQHNTEYVIGFGGRYKLNRRWSINADYGANLNRADNSPFVNPLSIGVDLETGGHVFQLHFTNAQPMLPAGFLTQSAGDWTDGRFYFGFNLARTW